MEQKTLTFTISSHIADMFTLAVTISGADDNEIFEQFAQQFSLETLNKLYSTTNTPSINNNPLPNHYLSKAEKKIPLWAKKLNQINAQIIRSFFLVEEDGIAKHSKMRDVFLKYNPDKTYFQFENNLNNMVREEGNSHGHIFDFFMDEVHIAEGAKDILLSYKNSFLEIPQLTPEEIDVAIDEILNASEMKELLDRFEIFCETPDVFSGKATSYANAIRYLCDFLKIEKIDEAAYSQIRDIENYIYDYNSHFYKQLLSFLSSRGQKSYLTNGFIRAALKYFHLFWEKENPTCKSK